MKTIIEYREQELARLENFLAMTAETGTVRRVMSSGPDRRWTDSTDDIRARYKEQVAYLRDWLRAAKAKLDA